MKRLIKLLPLSIIFLATSCIGFNTDGGTKTVELNGITLNANTQTIEINKTFQLRASFNPYNASNRNVTWSASNGNVTVSESGLVTAKAIGTSTVTVTSAYKSDVFATCEFTISEKITKVTSITLSKSSTSIEKGNTETITATVNPSSATTKTLSWTTSNSAVATVDNGIITALKKGFATITASATDGSGKKATCSVTITDASAVDAWTILVYMCGSNLESDYANKTGSGYDGVGLAVSDIMEILAVPNKPDDVNIVLETGGSTQWTKTQYANYGSEAISSSYLQRWHVADQKLVKDADVKGSGYNQYISMGLSSTLQSFVEYGLTTYPAQKTALILWNHGGAMGGVCNDDKASDVLVGTEVVEALQGAFASTGRTSKLEWIGYDACLMAMQDLAIFNADYFNYMVASQELESGTGWNYDEWVPELYSKKATTTILEKICTSFIDDNDMTEEEQQAYYEYYGEYYVNDQTLAYFDLSYADEYKTAWENMAGVLLNKVTNSNKSTFKNLVTSAKKFAEMRDGGVWLYNYYGAIDAKDFVDKLANDSTFNPGSSYISAFNTAFSHFVPFKDKGDGAGNANGLSMFYAIHANCDKESCYTASDTPLTKWQTLVDTYGESSSSGGWW